MEELHSKTQEASKKYLNKYKDLVKMVTGYEEANKHDDMKQVKGITSKIKDIIDKTLISEDEFVKLKKEQNEIMNEYNDLEKLRTKSPFSKESLKFSKTGSLSKSPDSGIETKSSNPVINDFNSKYTTDLSSLLTNFQKIEKKEKIEKIKEIEELESMNVCESETTPGLSPQKLKCDGTINQYYKMPDINIQITNGKDDTIRVKSTLDSKTKSKTITKSKGKGKSKSKSTSLPKKKTKNKNKKRTYTKKTQKKCLDNKVNNHKVF